jgi:hypothetical protein
MKKFIFTLKIRLGGFLLSILQTKTGYFLFSTINYIYNFPVFFVFIFCWFYNIIANYRYLKNNYSTEDLTELKNVGIDYIKKFRPYSAHINIITWLLILFLILIK